MDSNLYRPGAGKLPPLLVGRDRLVRDWVLRLNETRWAPLAVRPLRTCC